jgi:hypothetical protein
MSKNNWDDPNEAQSNAFVPGVTSRDLPQPQFDSGRHLFLFLLIPGGALYKMRERIGFFC